MMENEPPSEKRERPVLSSLFWVIIGLIAGGLLFLTHRAVSHPESDNIQNQSAFECSDEVC